MATNTPNALTNLLIEILFETADDVFVDIQAQDHFQSLELTLTSDAVWQGTLTLFDKLGGDLENLFIVTGSQRRMSLRWGWDDGRGINQYPPYICKVLKFMPSVAPEGITIVIEFMAAPAVEPLLNKELKPRSWPAGKTATEIFRDIAAKWGWVTVDQHGRSTVEESVGTLPEMSMADESDLKFIKEYLVPKAINVNERAFGFYFTRDAVHFHSPDYVTRSAAVYTFARDAWGDVIRFAPQDSNMFMAIMGGRAAQYESINAAEGQRTESNTTDDGPVEGGKNVVNPDSAYYEKLGDDIKAKISVVARTDQEFIQFVAHKMQNLRERTYTADLEVRGTHAIVPPEYVTVNYYRPDNTLYYLSGKFRTNRVTHRIDSSGWVTSAEMYREGVRQPQPSEAQTGQAARAPKADKQQVDQEIVPKEDAQTQGTAKASVSGATSGVSVPGTVTKTIVPM